MPSSNSNTTTPSCRLQQRFSQQRYQKTFTTRVRLLDEQELTLNFDTKILGKEMFQSVCETIKLLETSYFGLKVIDQVNEKRWLDDEKLVVKQSKKFLFSFSLKFYIPDPNQLEDEFTRYLYALQIKRDLANGDLACAEKTAALLASYIVQAELGDFLGSYDMEGQYLQGKQFYPNQTSAKQIAQNHCQHIGMSAAGADINMLNIVRKTEFYGMNLQSAMDHDDVALSLCAAYSGILVFQNTSRVNTFVWAKIRKINFKRKKLLIKLLSDNYGYHKDIVEFYFQSRDTCKNFWKCCIENHSFFRCVTVKDVIKRNKVILTRGSSFRYTGPTLLEAIDHSKDLLATGQITYKTFNRFYENRRKKIPQTSAPNPTTSEQNVEQYIVSRATHICNPAIQHFNPVDYPNNTNISSVTSQQNNRYHHHHYAMHPANLHNVQHQHDVGSTSARLSTCECDSSTHGSRTLDGGSERLDRSMSSVLNSSGDDDDELVSSQKPSAPTTSRRSAAVKVATVIRPISADPEAIRTSFHNVTRSNLRCRKHSAVSLSRDFGSSSSSSSSSSSFTNECGAAYEYTRRGPELEDDGDTVSCTMIYPPPSTDSAADSPSLLFMGSTYPYMSSGIAIRNETLTRPFSACKISENNQQRGNPEQYKRQSQSDGILNESTEESYGDRTLLADLWMEIVRMERSHSRNLHLIAEELRSHCMSKAICNSGFAEFCEWVFTSWQELYIFHSRPYFLERIYESCSSPVDDSERTNTPVVCSRTNINSILTFFKEFPSGILNVYRTMTTQLSEILINMSAMLYVLTLTSNNGKSNEKATGKQLPCHQFSYSLILGLLLKPTTQLYRYQVFINRLFYLNDDSDMQSSFADLRNFKHELDQLLEEVKPHFTEAVNLQKVLELQWEIGLCSFMSGENSRRKLIREGCVYKISKKGYLQRMILLFSDCLLYCCKSPGSKLRWNIRNEIYLADIICVEGKLMSSNQCQSENSKTVSLAEKCRPLPASRIFTLEIVRRNRRRTKLLRLVASCDLEKLKWIRDIEAARLHDQTCVFREACDVPIRGNCVIGGVQTPTGNNSLLQICWHRCLSVGFDELESACVGQLSGYLHRMCRNNCGWQCLWVVLSDLCLFFFRRDDSSELLASLPLLGYRFSSGTSVNRQLQFVPSGSSISQKLIFQLSFKNHSYLFRAENKFWLDRWTEVITKICPLKTD